MTTLALIATRKGLFKLTEQQQFEPVAFMGVPVSMVLASLQHDTWYAALDHGHFGVKLHRSDDAGQHWQEVTAPEYPKAEDVEQGDSLELIWSLEFAQFAQKDSGNAIWAGTIPGGLFYSEDGGESWVLNENLWQYKVDQQWFGGGYDHAGIHSICIDPRDSSKIRVGVSCAGVWQTNDAGISWQNRSQGMRAEYMPPEKQYEPTIQDPHRLVQCAADPDQNWVQHHNGIFRSTDGAESWQEIENVAASTLSTFGFAVAVHPEDANSAWFVPGVKDECRIPVDAKLVVNRTRDGGKSFQTLSKGLPESSSYDLIYRHGLDIDNSGNKLIMGSTTGNLWLSENQGDSWLCLSNYLPPVYAVRFLK